MKKKTILVTGGLGFIGSNLVLHLIKLNYFDNLKSKKELAMNYIPIEKTIIDFFQQFLDEKIA